MKLVLDAGALIALERHDRAMWIRYKAAHASGEVPVSHGGVVGQVWRGGGARQALLARALAGVDVRPLDDGAGRAAGTLLRQSRSADVIDAALVQLANDDDQIATSDVTEIQSLAGILGRRVEILLV